MFIKYTKIEKIECQNETIEEIENEIIEKINKKYPNTTLTIEKIQLQGRKYHEIEYLSSIGYYDYKTKITEEIMNEAKVTLSQTLPYNQKPKDPEFKRSSIEWYDF